MHPTFLTHLIIIYYPYYNSIKWNEQKMELMMEKYNLGIQNVWKCKKDKHKLYSKIFLYGVHLTKYTVQEDNVS